MAKMTERMMSLLDEVETAVFSTAALDGTPNAVPVGAKKIIDPETVLISDQFFNKTLANMQANPKASLTYWKGNEGYQLKGPVTIETSGPRFEETSKWIAEAAERLGLPLKCKGVALLHIEKIFGVSPGPGAGRQLA
jgi:predicted pyridoxine 5'-phosphate oxidase superfamily flavin-nucleotide-binding protein